MGTKVKRGILRIPSSRQVVRISVQLSDPDHYCEHCYDDGYCDMYTVDNASEAERSFASKTAREIAENEKRPARIVEHVVVSEFRPKETP